MLTGSNKAKNDYLGNSDHPKRFSEVIWILHLGNETGKGDLANEGIADVKEGIHA
jgi:hypothetical protein